MVLVCQTRQGHYDLRGCERFRNDHALRHSVRGPEVPAIARHVDDWQRRDHFPGLCSDVPSRGACAEVHVRDYASKVIQVALHDSDGSVAIQRQNDLEVCLFKSVLYELRHHRFVVDNDNRRTRHMISHDDVSLWKSQSQASPSSADQTAACGRAGSSLGSAGLLGS